MVSSLSVVLLIGVLVAAVCGGLLGAGWINPLLAALGIIGGGSLAVVGTLGMLDWMYWRSIPKEIIEKRVNETLLRISFAVSGTSPKSISLLGGNSRWVALPAEWPNIRAMSMPLPVSEIAALVSPPEMGRGVALLIAQPSRMFLHHLHHALSWKQSSKLASVHPPVRKLAWTGWSRLATGGSRTGKSSVMFGLLEQLIARGPDAPGIFLADPHRRYRTVFSRQSTICRAIFAKKPSDACGSLPRISRRCPFKSAGDSQLHMGRECARTDRPQDLG